MNVITWKVEVKTDFQQTKRNIKSYATLKFKMSSFLLLLLKMSMSAYLQLNTRFYLPIHRNLRGKKFTNKASCTYTEHSHYFLCLCTTKAFFCFFSSVDTQNIFGVWVSVSIVKLNISYEKLEIWPHRAYTTKYEPHLFSVEIEITWCLSVVTDIKLCMMEKKRKKPNKC